MAATQARGTVLVFEKMFESRLFFVDKLVSMGARIILCDPHRVVVTGPAKLYGQRLESPDIRAGMAMVIAALCAEGRSTIGNIGQIDRGYERIDERLRGLGAERRAGRAVSGARGSPTARASRTSRPASPCSTTSSRSSRARRASTWRSRSTRTTRRPRSTPPARALARGRAPARARCARRCDRPGSDEALAMVVVERSGPPLVASNADLTGAGGLGTDLAARFLGRVSPTRRG